MSMLVTIVVLFKLHGVGERRRFVLYTKSCPKNVSVCLSDVSVPLTSQSTSIDVSVPLDLALRQSAIGVSVSTPLSAYSIPLSAQP